MANQQSTSLVQGFINALLFPFKPGVLLYNVAGVILIIVALFGFIRLSIEMNQSMETVDTEAVFMTLPEEKQQAIEQSMQILRQQGTGDKELATVKGMMVLQASGQLPDEKALISRLLPSPFAIISVFLVMIVVMTRNLDITAQIADGDFTNPPLTPYNHVSPWIGLKLLAVYFALGFVLGFVNFFIILVSEWLALLLYILFGLFVPAIMLTLIATNSILETLNPKRWWETINEQVGTSNYAVLIALMVATMIISQIMGVLMEQITGNMLSLLVIMVVFIYIMFHIQSSNHYLMGFMTQKDIPDSEKADFSGYKERPRVKSQPAEAGNPILADAKTCMRSGHFEDAANLLNNLIANKAAPVIDKIHAYQMLVDVYRQLEQPAQILQTQHELLHYVTREAPHYKTKILSTVMALVKAGEFTPTPDEVHEIATLALAENQPELVLSLVGKFAKQVPEHPDVVANYLLAAKALDKQGQYEKAYRLLGGLIKKYPEHALMIEVKSEFLSVKRKLVQKQTAAKLQQPK